MGTSKSSKLSSAVVNELLAILQGRFTKNMHRHKGIEWADVEKNLWAKQGKLWSLNEMESSGGEPDVVGMDEKTGVFIFCDCSAESPKGRRSICYDRQALDARKENKPKTSALDMALEMDIQILNEAEYRALQKLEKVDTKTSSWLETPPEIRKLGGAIFGDYRYGQVFIYHNGADSYYGARGFRGRLLV